MLLSFTGEFFLNIRRRREIIPWAWGRTLRSKMRTPWIVALDVFCCVYSYWPYRWSCWRSLRRRCYPAAAAAATPIRFTILLLWLLHPKVSDISHFKSPFPPLRTRRLELLPHPRLDGWMAGWNSFYYYFMTCTTFSWTWVFFYPDSSFEHERHRLVEPPPPQQIV